MRRDQHQRTDIPAELRHYRRAGDASAGEHLTPHKTIGIAIALMAIWLLLGTGTTEVTLQRADMKSGLIRIMVATAAIGIGNLHYKYGLLAEATPASLIVTQAAVVVSLSTVLAVARDGGLRFSPGTSRHAPVAGCPLAAAFVMMVESLKRGEASTMVPVAQMRFVVTAALGVVLRRDRLAVRKAAGLIAALAALASVAFG